MAGRKPLDLLQQGSDAGVEPLVRERDVGCEGGGHGLILAVNCGGARIGDVVGTWISRLLANADVRKQEYRTFERRRWGAE
jgi:uncharacterized RDD family membrane protein YckC